MRYGLRKFFIGMTSILVASSLMNSAAVAESADRKIVINLASRSLALYEDNVRLRVYPVGVGKYSTPSPVGYYSILTKEIDPPWIDPDDPEHEIPSGPYNPIGYRWMQFHGNYGIHGTNKPSSIGSYVSNGCIRMYNEDVEELFDLVSVGTPVEITYNRVVVEKTPDDQIVYYVYPDAYGWQSLKLEDVTKWLDGYGIGAFESDEEIEQVIYDATGEPNYVGQIYPIEYGDQKLNVGAIVQDQVTYVPVAELSSATNVRTTWNDYDQRISSEYGTASAVEKKGKVYLTADDSQRIFHTTGSITDGRIYQIQPVQGVENPTKKDKTPKNKPNKKDKKGKDQQTNIVIAPESGPVVVPSDVSVEFKDKPNPAENQTPENVADPSSENTAEPQRKIPLVFDDNGNPLDKDGNIIPPKSDDSGYRIQKPEQDFLVQEPAPEQIDEPTVEKVDESDSDKNSKADKKSKKDSDKKSKKDSDKKSKRDEKVEKPVEPEPEHEIDSEKPRDAEKSRVIDPKNVVFDENGNPLDKDGNIIPPEDEMSETR